MSPYYTRFADAEAQQLGRMLDDQQRRNVEQRRAYESAFEIMARPTDGGMGTGCLIQPMGDGAVRRADASDNREAYGVIVRAERGLVWWSPLAVLYMGLVGTPAVGVDEIWLGENGHCSLSQPSVSTYRIQRVGLRLRSEGDQRHYCYICPRIDPFALWP